MARRLEQGRRLEWARRLTKAAHWSGPPDLSMFKQTAPSVRRSCPVLMKDDRARGATTVQMGKATLQV